MEKITYSTLAGLGEDFHRAFDSALGHEQKKIGQTHPLLLNGHVRKSTAGSFAVRSPSDARITLGHCQLGTPAHVVEAIAAARAAQPFWSGLGWQQRASFVRKAAAVMARHQFDLAALLTLETGKNRFESIAEVSEAVDLLLYYCNQMETHHGGETPMNGGNREQTRSVLRPYGVWVVISPFNFPLALPAGMIAAALLGGNTVIFKPATATPLSGLRLHEIFYHAGLPVGVCNYLPGSGESLGAELTSNPGVDGLAFTGSRAIGMDIRSRFTRSFPRPCILEMGGKNPVVIMPSADLDAAAEGVMRSAFGMGGQKCSACSRAYVHEQIRQPFLELLLAKTRALVVGDPAARETFLGPLINVGAVTRFQKAVRLGAREGRVLIGGHVLTKGAFEHGHFVEPTIIDQLPKTSRLFQEEYFVPLLAVAPVASLDEAIALANGSDYGLTAGIFTKVEEEREQFFDEIEAGVTYSNRRGGATTGAWPGVQSFGGWKGSGTTGKNALGPHYVGQFMREQSRTVCGS